MLTYNINDFCYRNTEEFEKRILGELKGRIIFMGINIKHKKGKTVLDKDRYIGGMEMLVLKRFKEESVLTVEELAI